MQGMNWLAMGSDGKPANHGVIVKEIIATKYLCSFAKTPSYCRVCDIAEIQRWLLFPDDEHMNVFILELRRQEMLAAAAEAAAKKAAANPPLIKPPVEKPKKKAKKKKVVKKPSKGKSDE